MSSEYVVQISAMFEVQVEAKSDKEAAELAAGFLEDGDYDRVTLLAADISDASVWAVEDIIEEDLDAD